jgi:hypothetical protein
MQIYFSSSMHVGILNFTFPGRGVDSVKVQVQSTTLHAMIMLVLMLMMPMLMLMLMLMMLMLMLMLMLMMLMLMLMLMLMMLMLMLLPPLRLLASSEVGVYHQTTAASSSTISNRLPVCIFAPSLVATRIHIRSQPAATTHT